MKWFKSIRRNSITFSICFILLFIAGNGLVDFYYRSVQEKHENLTKEVKYAQESMQALLDHLKNADLGIRGYYIVPETYLLDPYKQAAENLPRQLKKIEDIIIRNGMDVKDFIPVKKAFVDYFVMVEEMVHWRDQGNLAAIDSVINEDPGYDLWVVYDSYSKDLQQHMNASLEESDAITNRAILISTVVRFSLLLFGVPTLIIVLFRLAHERKRRRSLFANLDQNNKKYLFDPNEDEEVKLDENAIISGLISNLRKASEFISEIAKGNYGAQWGGLNDKNSKVNRENLVGELLQMRDQMIRVKEEDKVRMWETEGISKFSEIVRNYQDDMEQLSDQLTSNVARYLNANQAFLYFVVDKEDGDIGLELYGCYAYNRKKYLEKTIAPGQGLVGQTYLEKSINHLTSIPKNYVQITSGLGEATPTSLIIVPLKFNDQVEGILEIASFNTFKQHEIDFLERIGEIIASAIINLRSATKMKSLMQSMQSQSEEMKAQEEEMRQNMEELEATQEEMSRKAKEYQALLAEKDVTIAEQTREIAAFKKQIN